MIMAQLMLFLALSEGLKGGALQDSIVQLSIALTMIPTAQFIPLAHPW